MTPPAEHFVRKVCQCRRAFLRTAFGNIAESGPLNPARAFGGRTGPPVAGQGLFLAGEAVALPAEQIGQELQLSYRFRLQCPGPGIAGDLTDIGTDVVDTGVGIQAEPGQSCPDVLSPDQFAEVGGDRQAGEGEIPAQLPVLLLCHADGEISAIVPHRSAGPDLIPHGDSPPSAGRKTALPPGPDVPQRTAIPPLCHRRC